MANIKTSYEIKGLDFECDLVKLYMEIETLMAEKYDRTDCSPVTARLIEDDLSKQESAKGKATVT